MAALSPLPDAPALVLEAGGRRTLVVADLHVGLEWELGESGVHLPSGTARMRDALLECLEASAAEDVLILGDVKHNVPRTSGQEYRELPGLVAELSRRARVQVVPGNHDGCLERIVTDDVTYCPPGGVTVGEVGLLHGHTWPDGALTECKTLVCAHSHPTVRLADEVGYVRTERAWLRAPLRAERLRERYPGLHEDAVPRELVVLPAFNPRCGGLAVNREPALLGPLFARGAADLERARAFLLDGTYLGEVRGLREKSAEPGEHDGGRGPPGNAETDEWGDRGHG